MRRIGSSDSAASSISGQKERARESSRICCGVLQYCRVLLRRRRATSRFNEAGHHFRPVGALTTKSAIRKKDTKMNPLSCGLLLQANRPVRPKRFLDSGNEYESDSSLVFLSHKRRLRPLPYLSEFASTGSAALEKVSVPFMEESNLCEQQNDDVEDSAPTQDKQQQESSNVEEINQNNLVENAGNVLSTSPINPLEDPTLSTLTQIQHERYLKLLEMVQKGTLNTNRRKLDSKQRRLVEEFQTLKVAVQNERRQYKDAIKLFREQNINRFLVGFRPSVIQTESSTTIQLVQQIINEPLKAIHQWKDRWKMMTTLTTSLSPTHPKKDVSDDAAPSSDIQPPMYYGACIQTVALHAERCQINDCDIFLPPLDHCNERKGSHEQRRRIDIGDFNARVLLDEYNEEDSGFHVHISSQVAAGLDHKLLIHDIANKMEEPTPLLNMHLGLKSDVTCSYCPLQNDEKAKKLALQHNASVLLTSEAFSSLLHRPGNTLCRWKIPVFLERIETVNRRNIQKQLAIFEDPLPLPRTPREWMSCAFTGPLDSFLSSSSAHAQKAPPAGRLGWRRGSSSAETTSSDPRSMAAQPTFQFVYTLVTLPTSDKKSSVTVLVRSVNDIFDEDNNPIRRVVKLEYFYSPYGYLEEYTAYERVRWIMEKLLQPSCRAIVGRVNPFNGYLVSLEEKNIAMALAEENDSYFDPMPHFQVAGNIAKASKLLPMDRKNNRSCYIFCFPGCSSENLTTASYAASIHPAISKNKFKIQEPMISIEQELLAAESVFTNMDSLTSCFRMFEWDDRKNAGRVSYTFPFDNMKTTM